MARAEDSPPPTREYRPKAQTGADPEYPSKTHQPEPAPEILYIPEYRVNYYIAREITSVFFSPFEIDHSYHSFTHPLFCSNFLNLK